jgi:hypothetical protein
MSYFNEVMSYIKDRKERAESGIYNCIPLPFKRFREFLPGTEMGKFIVVTANQKVCKTKFCDFVYVYETLFFIMQHPEVRVKILYFCLEESAKKKYIEFQCHLLYRLDGIIISPTDLTSTDKDKPVPDHIIQLLESERYQKYIKKFEEMVEYIDNDKNPTGINKRCRDYALSQGHLNLKTIEVKDSVTGKPAERQIVDPINPYTPNDPELYKIVILDNAANLSLESGMDKKQTIEKMAKYAITLRNQLNFTFILVQHQAQAQEGIENFKLNKLKPSSDGLADCKTTTRDVNMVIGLYSPFKYGLPQYEGYDITKFRNHIRFMEIVEDRDYGANGNICPLYFDGAVSYFKELPRADNTTELSKVYKFMEDSKKRKASTLMMMWGKVINIFKND